MLLMQHFRLMQLFFYSEHVLLMLCLGVSGYVASTMYKKMGGENWVWNINLTSFLFAGITFQSCHLSQFFDIIIIQLKRMTNVLE